jgi:rubrerythrin
VKEKRRIMPLLRSEPPAPVRSLGELFALAEALEAEAASRYADLAGQMRAAGLASVADVFQHLAAEERGHAAQVIEWSRAELGAAPDAGLIRWQPPETFDEEEARTIASSRLASAYRALSMAVRNEERAFALWTYIAAQAEEPAVRQAAERMAAEELGHAALLRRERRRAFHAERGPAAAPRPRPAAEAARLERDLAEVLAALARGGGVPAERHAAELLRLARQAGDMADEARAAAEADAKAAEAGRPAAATARPGTPAPVAGATPDALAEALRLAELAVEDYLAAADAARDEEAMRHLQSLAERAIGRIALLRQIAAHG